MNARSFLRTSLLVSVLATPLSAHAQDFIDAASPSVRMRLDTIFRGVPRYVLTAQDGASSADDRYWRVIALAPLQERITIDAANLLHGQIEAHLAAWGAIDLTAPTAPDGRIAGDVAVAWVKYRRGPVSAWGGRRFLPWGAPGGVHIDGVGAEMQLGQGVYVEAMTGRPVTPVWGALLGPRPGFEGVTAAGGARVGWSIPGRISTAVSFLEHWADGIPVRRVVEASFVAQPLRWLDARGSISGDLLGLGVMQADLDASALLGRFVEVDAGIGHMNPALLIPRWSILSVFVTRTFDEARARLSWRIIPTLQVGLEAAGQHYDVAGRDPAQWGPAWGSRIEGFVRVTALERRVQFMASASHRDDGERRMTLMRLAAAFEVVRQLFAAAEAAVALDNDDINSGRTSYFGRVSVDGAFLPGWRVGASVDGVHSPIASAELRAMLHLTAQIDLRLGASR